MPMMVFMFVLTRVSSVRAGRAPGVRLGLVTVVVPVEVL
jgi:hypothetical protein